MAIDVRFNVEGLSVKDLASDHFSSASQCMFDMENERFCFHIRDRYVEFWDISRLTFVKVRVHSLRYGEIPSSFSCFG